MKTKRDLNNTQQEVLRIVVKIYAGIIKFMTDKQVSVWTKRANINIDGYRHINILVRWPLDDKRGMELSVRFAFDSKRGYDVKKLCNLGREHTCKICERKKTRSFNKLHYC